MRLVRETGEADQRKWPGTSGINEALGNLGVLTGAAATAGGPAEPRTSAPSWCSCAGRTSPS